MNPTGRPKGEFRRAQHEGTPVSALPAGLRAWGWLAPASALMALTGAVLPLALAPHFDTQQAHWRHQLQARQARQQAPSAPTASAPTPRERLADLPPAATRQARQAALLALPARHGLQSSGSEITLQYDVPLGVVQWRVQQSWRGSYADVHAAVSSALAADAALGLEQLRLSRRQPEAAEVDAEVSWVLFWRQGAAEPQP